MVLLIHTEHGPITSVLLEALAVRTEGHTRQTHGSFTPKAHVEPAGGLRSLLLASPKDIDPIYERPHVNP